MSKLAIVRGVCAVVMAGVSLLEGAGLWAQTMTPGAVVAWGRNDDGQCNVPSLPSGLWYESVAGGVVHSLALRSDGAVVAWGYNGNGQCNVPSLPSGLRYESVAGGREHSLALRSDGAVVALGALDLC